MQTDELSQCIGHQYSHGAHFVLLVFTECRSEEAGDTTIKQDLKFILFRYYLQVFFLAYDHLWSLGTNLQVNFKGFAIHLPSARVKVLLSRG